MAHEVFHYHSKQEIEQTARAQGVFLPWSEDTAVLAQPLSIGAHTASAFAAGVEDMMKSFKARLNK